MNSRLTRFSILNPLTRLLMVMGLIVLITACSPQDEAPRDTRQLVSADVVEEGELQRHIAFSGVLQPVNRAALSFQTSGILASRPVALGQLVEQGTLLAALNNPELEPAEHAAAAQLQEVMTRRDQARRDLRRLSSLRETGAVGEDALEQQQAEVNALEAAVGRAEANLESSQQRLEDATLVAPFDGVVSRIYAEPGEFLSAGQAVVSIGGQEAVEVRILIPASLAESLRLGNTVTVRVPQLNSMLLDGQVMELSTIGDVETGLFPVVVEVALSEDTSLLRAGMQVEVQLIDTTLSGLIVPLAALVDPTGSQPRVYKMNQGKVASIPVVVSGMSGSQVAISPIEDNVLLAGDQVVTGGHRSLSDGQAVRLAQ